MNGGTGRDRWWCETSQTTAATPPPNLMVGTAFLRQSYVSDYLVKVSEHHHGFCSLHSRVILDRNGLSVMLNTQNYAHFFVGPL